MPSLHIGVIPTLPSPAATCGLWPRAQGGWPCPVALGVNRKTKGGDEAMFIDVVAWDRLAELCNQYLKKGMSTLVEGRLAIRSYETKHGEKLKAVEIVAGEMQKLDSKGRTDSAAAAAARGGSHAPTSTTGLG